MSEGNSGLSNELATPTRLEFPLILEDSEGKLHNFIGKEFLDEDWDHLDTFIRLTSMRTAHAFARTLPSTEQNTVIQNAVKASLALTYSSKEGRLIMGTPDGVSFVAALLTREPGEDPMKVAAELTKFFRNDLRNMDQVVWNYQIVNGELPKQKVATDKDGRVTSGNAGT